MAESRKIRNSRHADDLAFTRPNLEFAAIIIRDLHGGDYAPSPTRQQDRSLRVGHKKEGAHAFGMWIVKVLPWPGVLSTVTVP